MAAVQGTASYVYFLDHSLGVGASGSVYLGRHKRHGFKCACKVFRSDGGPREEMAKQREFDVMKKLSHENVVKFFAIEQESHGKAKILIMEYCAGGSVYKMLEEPRHVYGFREEEFIIFLRDITKALQYLSKERIVHRDIKPGNILRCIGDDLRSIYKLTDFGAARQLPESGEFMSLYGTEEYLHPEIYGRALLGNRQFVPLTASVDLWSVGVTIYHVATGHLPFQSFGGRQNKEEMHRITSKKRPGVISGIQHVKDGPIDWSEELPQTCYLSRGLKKPLERMLRHLLEVDDVKRWNFETFFNESRKITSHAPFHVFYVSTAMSERVYLTRCNATSSHLQEELAELTNLPSARQRMYHCWYSLGSLLRSTRLENNQETLNLQETTANTGSDDQTCCSSRQKTTSEQPIVLYPSNYVAFEWRLASYELPNQCELSPSPTMTDDVNLARAAAGYVIYIHYTATRVISAQSALVEFVKCMIDQLSKEIRSIQTCGEIIRQMVDKRQNLLCRSRSPPGESVGQNEARVVQHILSSVQEFENEALMSFIDQCRSKLCSAEHRCLKKLEFSIQELESIYEVFCEHKRKELSHNEQQIHKFDRGRIPTLVSKAYEHYTTHCRPNSESLLSIVTRWFSSVYLPKKTELDNNKEIMTNYILKIQSSSVSPLMPHPPIDGVVDVRPVGRTEPIPVNSDKSASGLRPSYPDGRSATRAIRVGSARSFYTRSVTDPTLLMYTPSSSNDVTDVNSITGSDMGIEFRTSSPLTYDKELVRLEDGSSRIDADDNDDFGIAHLISYLQQNSELITMNTVQLTHSSDHLKSLLDSLLPVG